jgi:hypothetical protein
VNEAPSSFHGNKGEKTMKAKVKFVSVGLCRKCGQEFVRPSSCTHAVCNCHNPEPIIVTLEPALIIPEKLLKPYRKIAELTGVSDEDLANAILKVGIERFMEKRSVTSEL